MNILQAIAMNMDIEFFSHKCEMKAKGKRVEPCLTDSNFPGLGQLRQRSPSGTLHLQHQTKPITINTKLKD
jgi:hypothetical protein